MRFIKAIIIPLGILLVFLSFIPGFSQTKDKIVIASGVIEQVGATTNLKYISINERRIALTPDATFKDEYGRSLTVNDLKPGLKATVELIRGADGRVEKRITVKR